jgi:hypothetical protein
MTAVDTGERIGVRGQVNAVQNLMPVGASFGSGAVAWRISERLSIAVALVESALRLADDRSAHERR